MSPSGKAAGFGPVIRRFDPCHPSHFCCTNVKKQGSRNLALKRSVRFLLKPAIFLCRFGSFGGLGRLSAGFEFGVKLWEEEGEDAPNGGIGN